MDGPLSSDEAVIFLTGNEQVSDGRAFCRQEKPRRMDIRRGDLPRVVHVFPESPSEKGREFIQRRADRAKIGLDCRTPHR
jgi:hypothetical protein